MPRIPRSLLPDGTFHVTAHAVPLTNLFRGPGDRRYYLSLLQLVAAERRWVVLAFCLMGNHLHMLLESTTADLSKGFWLLHKRYAERYNASEGRRGCLFDGRFYSKVVKTEHQRAATIRYIAVNPVEAGFCTSPEGWVWSSHRPLMGLSTIPPFLAAERAREIVGGVDGYRGLVLGPDPPEHEYLQRGEAPPLTLDPEIRDMLARGDDRDLLYLHRELGITQHELATALDVDRSTVKRRIDRVW